jgi:hypothetical protein
MTISLLPRFTQTGEGTGCFHDKIVIAAPFPLRR